MSILLSLILAVHVIAGVIALVVGFVAIVTTKGGSRHNAAGRSYVLSMGIVVLTAVPLSIAVRNWFLLAIAVFTGYLVFAGIRVITRRHSRTERVEGVDLVGHGVMVFCGAVMVFIGAVDTVLGISGLGPVLVVFGAVGIGLSGREFHTIRLPPNERIPWFRRHIGFMGGAYIATVTASITVNLPVLPPLVQWLGPTAIGIPLITLATRKYESRFSRRVPPAPSSRQSDTLGD